MREVLGLLLLHFVELMWKCASQAGFHSTSFHCWYRVSVIYRQRCFGV